MHGIESWLRLVMDIPGALSATLVDGASGLLVAAAGRHPMLDDHENAALATDVVHAITTSPAFASEPVGDYEEIIISRSGSYHLVVPVPGNYSARLFVHAMFDTSAGNLALARYRLRTVLADLTAR